MLSWKDLYWYSYLYILKGDIKLELKKQNKAKQKQKTKQINKNTGRKIKAG